MISNSQNVSYDLSLFEAVPREKQKKQNKSNVIKIPEEKLNIIKSKKIKPTTAIGAFLSFVVIISIVAAMIYSQVQLTELTEQINVSSKQLDEKQSIATQLQMKVEAQTSLKTVEEYAKKNLNMSKIEPSQIEYINLSGGDKAEIKKDNSKNGILDAMKNVISKNK